MPVPPLVQQATRRALRDSLNREDVDTAVREALTRYKATTPPGHLRLEAEAAMTWLDTHELVNVSHYEASWPSYMKGWDMPSHGTMPHWRQRARGEQAWVHPKSFR